MASRGVNKVILLGNVGQEPECRTFSSGDLVANFSIATSETWQDRNTGEDREKTEWHRCVAYRGLAGVIQRYVHKGSKLYVEGKLQTRKWQDQNGLDRYSTEIIVENMQMLDSRNNGNAQGSYQQDEGYHLPQGNQGGNAFRGGNQGYNNAPQQGYSANAAPQNHYGQPPAPPAAPAAPQNPDAGMSGDGFSDDEIPF